MILFGFNENLYATDLNNKIVPAPNGWNNQGAYQAYIVWKIKGVSGYIYTPQPHTNGHWSYMSHDNYEAPYLLTGKCTDAHATMILQYIAGKKWQSRIKKAYSARNRWDNGKAI